MQFHPVKALVVSVVLIVWMGSVFAQTEPTTTANLDELRSNGYQALYNLDYDTARKDFKQIIQMAPDNPVGPQCLATAIWLQRLNEGWEINASLYSNKADTEDNDKVDAEERLEFRNLIRQSKQLSQARLRRNPHDQEALYLLGAAEGLEAAYFAGVERRFMSALRSAQDATEHHRALLKVAPAFHDAELTIGLYNYVVGDLPLPVKILVGPMGVKGSKKRGLETLERVAREGHWARDLALVLLVDLYKRQKRWPDAIRIARELVARYPRNYLFKLQLADALTYQNLSTAGSPDQMEVFAIFDALVSGERSQTSAIVHFRYGETLLLLGNATGAEKQFHVAFNSPNAPPLLHSMSQLRIAQCLDIAGKRSEALSSYRAVLKSSTSKNVLDDARRGLREPYKRLRE